MVTTGAVEVPEESLITIDTVGSEEELVNLEYLKSAPAILKITQLVGILKYLPFHVDYTKAFLLSAFLLVHTSWFSMQYVYMAFQIITLTLFFLTFLFLCAAAFNLPRRISPSCGPVTECVLDIVALVYVFSVSCAAAVRSYDVPVLVAASILGLLVSFLMATSAWISVRPVYCMMHSKLAPHIAAEV